jgi:hypothetical protein
MTLKCALCNWDIINGNCSNRLHCSNKKEYRGNRPLWATTAAQRDQAYREYMNEKPNNGWAGNRFGYED